MKSSMATIEKPDPAGSVGAGSQTLMRGLDLIEAVSHEVLTLSELAAKLDLTKSTTHRLLSALVDRGYRPPRRVRRRFRALSRQGAGPPPHHYLQPRRRSPAAQLHRPRQGADD